ncbi:type II secretion system protein [Marinagarivorans algicola]|uniref:type II secretion system protein n=1 Tax=Marinagarivorans algicola TaxID=1513270 RepID=UPI0006B93628|nr:type II secretion system protein [Marinagarivorans algicola]
MRTFGSLFTRRQAGMAMVEVIASVTLAGSAAAVIMTQQQGAQELAARTQANLSAAALSSAVKLQQAKWAVGGADYSPLRFSKTGVVMGLDTNPAASLQDCQALWQHLIVQPPSIAGARHYWRAAPESKTGSVRCQFSYHHNKLPAVTVFYNTKTGGVSFD